MINSAAKLASSFAPCIKQVLGKPFLNVILRSNIYDSKSICVGGRKPFTLRLGLSDFQVFTGGFLDCANDFIVRHVRLYPIDALACGREFNQVLLSSNSSP